MTTLLMAEDKNGKVGRCDERCHRAKNPICNCICGGTLHGIGLEKAAERVEEVYRRLIDAGFIHVRKFPYQFKMFN